MSLSDRITIYFFIVAMLHALIGLPAILGYVYGRSEMTVKCMEIMK